MHVLEKQRIRIFFLSGATKVLILRREAILAHDGHETLVGKGDHAVLIDHPDPLVGVFDEARGIVVLTLQLPIETSGFWMAIAIWFERS